MILLSYNNQLLFLVETFDPGSLETTATYPLYNETVTLPTKGFHIVTENYTPKVMELQPKWKDLIHQREMVVHDTNNKRRKSYATKGKSKPKAKTLQQLILSASPEELPELLAKHGYGDTDA